MLFEIQKVLTPSWIPWKNQDNVSQNPTASSNSNVLTSAAYQENSLNDFKKSLQEKVDAVSTKPSAEVSAQFDKVNQSLKAAGKPELDYARTQSEIRSILENSSLSEKDKKKAIEDLSKRLGITKKEMRALFTDPLSKVFKAAAQALKQRQKDQESKLSQELAWVEAQYGKNSPQALEVKNKQASLKTNFEPQVQKFQEQAKVCKESCKKQGFWSKLGSAFKSIGNFVYKALEFAKPFLAMVPGWGTLANMAISGLETVVEAVKSKGKSLASSGANFLQSLIPGGGFGSAIAGIGSKFTQFFS